MDSIISIIFALSSVEPIVLVMTAAGLLSYQIINTR